MNGNGVKALKDRLRHQYTVNCALFLKLKVLKKNWLILDTLASWFMLALASESSRFSLSLALALRTKLL